MAVGLPTKVSYVDGDVFSASDINDTNGTINLIGQTTNFYAGKNKIINGDFFVNQRNFSSTTTDQAYGFDRFLLQNSGGCTYSAQTFTTGTAPVAGYEGRNFARLVTAGQTIANTYSVLTQKIESVRTFAGETVTLSFWAKAASGTPKVAFEVIQTFGSGGSTAVSSVVGTVTLSTSWARYSFVKAIPSISGKTVGTSDCLTINLWVSAGTDFAGVGTGIQSNTFDFWGVQLEAGSTATAFETATGTIQGELAACQRYYWRTGGDLAYQYLSAGFATATTQAFIPFRSPSTFRVPPTSLEYSTLAIYAGGSIYTVTSASINAAGKDTSNIQFGVASGLVGGGGYYVITNNSLSGYVALNAEL